MSNIVIQANDCIFAVDLGVGFVPVLCAKSFTVNVLTDEKEITTVGDGLYKDFDYKILSYTLNLNGAIKIQDGANPAIFDFLDFQKNFIEVSFRVIWESGIQVKRFEGRAIVKSTNILCSSGQVADGTVDLIGKGEFILADSLPNMVNLRLLMTGNDAEQAFCRFHLINTDGEIVFQTDVLPQSNGGKLANPFDITVLVPKGNWYYWWEVDTNMLNNQFDLNAPPTKSSNFQDNLQTETSYPSTLYDFNADRQVTFTLGIPTPPPTCVPPALSGTFAPPDGTVGSAYFYSFLVNGSNPFTISNVTKPSWMTVTPSGGTISLSGTPDASGTGITVSFDISNACGTVSVSDTINIASVPITNSTLNYGLTFGGPVSGIMRIYKNAFVVATLTHNGSGSITCSPGDSLEVQVSGHAGTTTNSLFVANDTDSITLYSNTDTSGAPQSYFWTAGNGKIYSANAEIDPA